MYIVTAKRLEEIRILYVSGRYAETYDEISKERQRMGEFFQWDTEPTLTRSYVKEILNYIQGRAQEKIAFQTTSHKDGLVIL